MTMTKLHTLQSSDMQPDLSYSRFRQLLKTFSFQWDQSAAVSAAHPRLQLRFIYPLTYLFTYLLACVFPQKQAQCSTVNRSRLSGSKSATVSWRRLRALVRQQMPPERTASQTHPPQPHPHASPTTSDDAAAALVLLQT